MAKKYLIETFGCQMNFHDSERMAGLLEQAGYESTADDRDADVIVINTCSVREKAEEKLFPRLGEIHHQGLETGERHRNTELSVVRDGRLVETNVFFGGRYDEGCEGRTAPVIRRHASRSRSSAFSR